jgi:DNA ligase-4
MPVWFLLTSFRSFCHLVRAIGSVEPASVAGRRKPTSRFDYPALNKFELWVKELRAKYFPLRPGTTTVCFKFLFPEEDVRRKYNIQETAMMKSLAESLGKQRGDFDGWNQKEASGCLGHEVKNALAESCSVSNAGFHLLL